MPITYPGATTYPGSTLYPGGMSTVVAPPSSDVPVWATPLDEVLAGTCVWTARVTSWLGGTLLAAHIPIIAGRVSAKAGDDVPEKLSMTVPRYAQPDETSNVVDWRPASTMDPLARYGQELDVTIVITSIITGLVYEYRVGRYLITDWTDDDQGVITVKGEGLLRRVKDAKLLTPTSPTGTFKSEAQRLLPPGMGVSFDPALVDRACPTSMSWSEDRLGAFQEIASAWPALLRTDVWGQLRFSAPLPTVPRPSMTLTDGQWGTLITAPRTDTRTEAYNTVIATSSNTNTADVQGIAQVTSGALSVNGPYGSVVKKWSSPLLTTIPQAQAAAQTMLENSMRPTVVIPVHCAPDPRLTLDTAVQIVRGTDPEVWGYVTAYDLPLTTADGDMRVDVAVA